VIEVLDLVVSYKWRQEPVLKGFSVSFRRKSIILGPNGSGKTTLFRAICGFTNISSGRVLVEGRDVAGIYAAPGLLSVNFREAYGLLGINVLDLISLYIDISRGQDRKVFEVLGELGLSPGLMRRRKLDELSAGQVKAVSTALALASGAKYVLLDEPFEQLDPARKGRLTDFLNGYEGVVLMNTHETWLLRRLEGWAAYFMFEGLIYGPVEVGDLLSIRVSPGEEPESLLRINVGGRTISLVKEEKGTLLTSLESLDRVYELIGS